MSISASRSPRNYEALIEICYTFQINAGWSVQPNFQYIFQPGGNVDGSRERNGRGGTHQHKLLTKDECTHPIPGSAICVTESSQKASPRQARRAWLGGAIAVRRGSAAGLPASADLRRRRRSRDREPARADHRLQQARAGRGQARAAAPPRAASTDTANAFSLSSGNMDFKRELDFKIGNAIFRKNWVSAPSSTDASDGLGPLFNSRACQNCHLKDGRGHPPLSADVPDDSGSMLVRLSVPAATDEEKDRIAAHSVNSIPDPTYGGQLQDRSIQGFAAEGKLKIDYTERKVTLAGGEVVNLRAPHYSLTDLAYGPISPDVMISPARRAADDRARPARSGARGADPRQRRSRRREQGRHLRQAEPRLVARARQGDARPLRLEGRRAHHRPAGGRGLCRRYRAFPRP